MSSHRLSSFLEKYELPNKEGMEIGRMLKLVKNSLNGYDTCDEMTEVVSYCNTDSVSVFRLDNKVNYIGDGRAVADLSRTTVYGSFYKAGAYRVGNMVGHRYYHSGYIYSSNVTNNSTSFKGAFVVQPPRGFITAKQSLIELGIDNKELHEQISKTAAVADKVITMTSDHIEFIADEKEYKIIRPSELGEKEWNIFTKFIQTKTDYPDGDIDYVSLYPSVIITYNISPEKMITKDSKLNGKESIIKQDVIFSDTDTRTIELVRHNSNIDEFGIIPLMLSDIFTDRIKIKNLVKALKEKDPKNPLIEYYDMVQKAKKLMMNTTYGVMGSGFSFIAEKILAAMVTTMGRILLEQISKFALENGVIRRYGDTDSGYFYLLKKWFAEVDKLYYSNQITKIAYYKKLHSITREGITSFEHKCNKMLAIFSGFNQLKTEFGHSHFPILYVNKKQYASCVDGNLIIDPHKLETYEDIQIYSNLCMDKDKGLFIKGLSLKKRNASKFLQKTMCIVLVKLLAVNNSHVSTLDFVKTFILDILLISSDDGTELNTKIPFKKSDFIRSIQFKGISDGKQGNITLLEFAERMRKTDSKVPEKNDIIEYVYADLKDTFYSESGSVKHPKTSEYMEWYSEIERLDRKISIKQYIKSELAGSLASVIAFHPNFNEFDITDDEDTKIKRSITKAKRFIESKCIPQTKSISKTRIYSKINSVLRSYETSIFRDRLEKVNMDGMKDGLCLANTMDINHPAIRDHILKDFPKLISDFNQEINQINLEIKAEEKKITTYINEKLISEIRDELGLDKLIPKKTTDLKRSDVEIIDVYDKVIKRHKAIVSDPFDDKLKKLYDVICMKEAIIICHKKIIDNDNISKKEIDDIFDSQSIMGAINLIK
jgi:DNA polymerase elongation subunit (family B)